MSDVQWLHPSGSHMVQYRFTNTITCLQTRYMAHGLPIGTQSPLSAQHQGAVLPVTPCVFSKSDCGSCGFDLHSVECTSDTISHGSMLYGICRLAHSVPVTSICSSASQSSEHELLFARDVRRYLWTDAFGVCAYLSLYHATKEDRCASHSIFAMQTHGHALGQKHYFWQALCANLKLASSGK